jgi:hypothetical protein
MPQVSLKRDTFGDAMKTAILLAALATPAVVWAQAVPFQGADLALGQRLIVEHACAQCHARKVGGDGSAIYRPAGRINSAAKLRSMVEICSTELKLQLFPEELEAIAAVLNRDHYRFE